MVFLDVGSIPPLGEWETLMHFTYTTKKATRGEQLWCLWLGDAYCWWWLGWCSEQQTQDERFHITLPTTQPKCANKINRNPLETHRIQLFWLYYHIHGKLQAVYWKISSQSCHFLFFSSVYVPSIFTSWQRLSVFWEGLKIGFCSTERYLVVGQGCN